MVLPFDEITRKKLVTVRYLYQEGITKSDSLQNFGNRIISIINFDLAIETTLYVICSLLDPSRNPPTDFPDKVNKVDTLMIPNYGNLPDKVNINHVHMLRNNAQHKAIYPNESEVTDCRTYVRDFLEKTIKLIWNVEFQRITLTGLIRHKRAKAYLIGAEGAFSKNNYTKTVELSAAGLEWAIGKVSNPFVGRDLRYIFSNILTMRGGNPEENRDLTEAIKRMQGTLRLDSLGLNISNYIRFRQITGPVMVTWNGVHNVDQIKPNLTLDEAEYVLNYAINSIVQIESLVGNIEQPFGRQWW